MLHQDMSRFGLGMNPDFLKWQFQPSIQETSLPYAFEWFVLYIQGLFHRALARRVMVDAHCGPFMAGAVGRDPPRLVSCLIHSPGCFSQHLPLEERWR